MLFRSSWYWRTRPAFCERTTPHSSSTDRCWEKEGRAILNGRASSVMEAGLTASWATTARRVGSDRARNTRLICCSEKPAPRPGAACWMDISTPRQVFGQLVESLHAELDRAETDGRVALGAVGMQLPQGQYGLAIALFGAIAAMIAGLFVDRVARVVELRYYPGLPPARTSGIGEQISGGLSFFVAFLALNLLVLPLYLIWGVDVPIFLGLNGYLLGREYFELVALRRVDRRTARLLWRSHRLRLILCGALIAAFSFVPFANLLTPVLATAFMLHIFQDLLAFEEACGARHFGDTPRRSPTPTLRKT